MTRKTNRNSSLIFVVGVILALILAVAFAAKAQVSPPASTPLNFMPPLAYDSGAFLSTSVAVGDLNGDGKLDIVVSNSCLSYDDCPFNDVLDVIGHPTVGVLLGRGDGTFKPVVTYDTGGFQRPDVQSSVALADMNGDGILDIIVTNSCGYIDDCAQGTVSVLYGNGDGTFKPTPTGGWSNGFLPVATAVGDVNGDGKLDLVTVNICSEQSTCDMGNCTCPGASVSILLNDGWGYFRPGGVCQTGAPWGRGIATGDLNGDGKLDMVAVQDGSVSVLLGSGEGSFQPPVLHNIAGLYVASVALADVNGDGKLDLLLVNGYPGSVSVLLGNGDGTFRSPWLYSLGGTTSSLAVGDLNGDGKPDLAIATGSGIAVLLGNGNGTFQSPATFGSRSDWSYAVAIGDVNADGKPDLVTANVYSPLGFYEDSAAAVWINNSGAATSTVVTSSLNPSFVGQPITFTATTWSVAGFPADGETITFKNGSLVLGTATLKGAKASLTTSTLPVGTFKITANYAGDKKFAASASPALSQVVRSTTKSLTSTLLVSSLNPSIYGQNVTWAAKVTVAGSHPPTGSVVFRWSRDGQYYNIGTATLNPSGVAMLSRSNLSANPFGIPYPLVAVYMGDTANLASASAVLQQSVLHAKTTAALTSSLNPSTHGQTVTFTAKITAPTVIPTGTVTFSVGTTVLGTAQLSGGTAKFTTTSLPVGANRVKVTYSGNSNIAQSSATVLQTVQ